MMYKEVKIRIIRYSRPIPRGKIVVKESSFTTIVVKESSTEKTKEYNARPQYALRSLSSSTYSNRAQQGVY